VVTALVGICVMTYWLVTLGRAGELESASVIPAWNPARLAHMTGQLEEARRGVELNRGALEAAKARLENILANLSAGVLVFDHEQQLSISNHGAAAILGASRPEQVDDNVAASGVELGDDVLERIDEILGGVLVAAPMGD